MLGRTKSGTLRLRLDEHGLWGEIDINPDDSDAMNAYTRIERGDVAECSFGFDIIREEQQNLPNGDWHFRIMEVVLYEVSPCTFPAYKQTSIDARANELKSIQARQLDVWKANMKERIHKKC